MAAWMLAVSDGDERVSRLRAWLLPCVQTIQQRGPGITGHTCASHLVWGEETSGEKTKSAKGEHD